MKAALRKFASFNWQALARKAGQAYVSGPELDDALRNFRHLSGLGLRSTICYWNMPGDSPQEIADASIKAALALAAENLDGYLSIKLPPLKSDSRQLDRIMTEAASRGILVHFDAHGAETADATFSAIVRSMAIHRRLGCTLPGRWARSCSDAERAIDLGLHVRVVKGQWVDPANPDIDLAEGFLRVIDCLAGRARSVAVATHDPKVAREALQRLQSAGTACVLELLYGLPVSQAMKLAQEMSVPVRIYIPFGYGWLPYSLGQARRNPHMLWWIVRDYLAGGSPFGTVGLSSKIHKSYL